MTPVHIARCSKGLSLYCGRTRNWAASSGLSYVISNQTHCLSSLYATLQGNHSVVIITNLLLHYTPVTLPPSNLLKLVFEVVFLY